MASAHGSAVTIPHSDQEEQGALDPAAEARRYRRPFGRPRSPHVQADIAKLDAKRDCQRIVELLSVYEFPFDMQRALEVALFHTYGSRSVSRLLDRTGEFGKRGQKRYDDTRILIARFMESGWDLDLGSRALRQMNHVHSFYKIPNEDFLFVLWTFIDFPIQWLSEYGWRPMSAHECKAWFHFWTEVGRRMGLSDIPESKAAFDEFVRKYEAEQFVFNEPSQRVAGATLRILENWFPSVLRPLVAPAVLALVRPQLLTATGYKRPPQWLCSVVSGVLRIRGFVKRFISLEKVPSRLATTPNRTYPKNDYTLETIGPEHTHRAPPAPPLA